MKHTDDETIERDILQFLKAPPARGAITQALVSVRAKERAACVADIGVVITGVHPAESPIGALRSAIARIKARPEKECSEMPAGLEAAHLRQSPITCAVADEFQAALDRGSAIDCVMPAALFTAMTRLEAATRGSALRKVKP